MPPVRTCVACREADGPDALVRLVAAPDGSVVVDLKGRLPGRGAWVHPTRACVSRLAARPGALQRALGVSDAGRVAERVKEAVLRAALDGVSLAAASGSVVGGHDVLRRELAGGRVEFVVTATDASERTLASLRAVAGEVPFVELPLTRVELGARTGRGERAALGVLPTRGASHLRRQLRRLVDLG